jgi:hypothetical protein
MRARPRRRLSAAQTTRVVASQMMLCPSQVRRWSAECALTTVRLPPAKCIVMREWGIAALLGFAERQLSCGLCSMRHEPGASVGTCFYGVMLSLCACTADPFAQAWGMYGQCARLLYVFPLPNIYDSDTSIHALRDAQSSLLCYMQFLRWWHLSGGPPPRGDEPRCPSCGQKTAWAKLILQVSDSRSPQLVVDVHKLLLSNFGQSRPVCRHVPCGKRRP